MNPAHIEQDMHVIVDAANDDKRRSHVAHNGRKISMNSVTNVVLQEWKSILRTEDQVSVELRYRLWHRVVSEVIFEYGRGPKPH